MRPAALVPLHIHENLRRAALGLWGALVVAIAVASLLPNSGPPSEFGIDKILHLLGYGAAAGLPFLAFHDRRPVYSAAILMLPMGLVLEALQDFVPTRTADFGDVVANSGGALLGLALGPRARRLTNRWFPVAPKAAPPHQRP